MRHLQPRDLHAYLASGAQPLLLDVREAWEYQICHLPDSTLLPMGQVLQQYQTLDSARETVVICHHGVRSQQVAFFLESRGFKNLINLSGGIDVWAKTVDPHMSTY